MEEEFAKSFLATLEGAEINGMPVSAAVVDLWREGQMFCRLRCGELYVGGAVAVGMAYVVEQPCDAGRELAGWLLRDLRRAVG